MCVYTYNIGCDSSTLIVTDQQKELADSEIVKLQAEVKTMRG